MITKISTKPWSLIYKENEKIYISLHIKWNENLFHSLEEKKSQSKQISLEWIGKNVHNKVNLSSTDCQKLDLQVNVGYAPLFEVTSSDAAWVGRIPLLWVLIPLCCILTSTIHCSFLVCFVAIGKQNSDADSTRKERQF